MGRVCSKMQGCNTEDHSRGCVYEISRLVIERLECPFGFFFCLLFPMKVAPLGVMLTVAGTISGP